MRFRVSTAAIASTLFFLATAGPGAWAQSAFPASPGVSLERFLPPVSSNRIFAVPTTETMALFDFSVALAADWAKSPLKVPDGGDVISHQVNAQILAAIGLGRFELGLGFPVVVFQATDYPDRTQNPGFATAAAGDLRFDGKVRLTPKESRFGAAVEVLASFPTGGGDHYASESGFGFAGRLVGDAHVGPVLIAAYAGYRYRTSPATLINLYISDEIMAGLGVQVMLLRDRLDLFGESWASVPLHSNPVNNVGRELFDAPIEAILGLKIRLPEGMEASVGAGPGITHGYGSPTVRVVAGFGWTRQAKDTDRDGIPNSRDKCPTIPEDKDGFEDEDGCPDPDNDKDDIPDEKDQCPNQAEDRDGFEDDDGCPDPDNDKDGIPDDKDKCPNEPEDKDGFQDEDGCPDTDNDLDGIADDKDKCPLEPEDKDGYRDEDGCIDPDNDGDGIPDIDDKCPNQAEDFDGFEDDDGCPDPDNDHDGFPDYKDKCPNQPETFNGYKDEDGCPEKGHGNDLVRVGDSSIEIKDRVYFATGSSVIESKSFKLLDAVALVVNLHTEIRKIIIAGHSDSVGNPDHNRVLSQQRADSVKTYLIEKGGVDPYRLDAKGFGFDEPLLPEARTPAQHEVNRRVEFRIER